MSVLEELRDACRAIGDDRMLVQKGGGNASVKTDDQTMIVKASGVDLKEVTLEKGFVNVYYNSIAEAVASITEETFSVELEKQYNRELKQNAVTDTGARPSMETGFHAVLGKALMHTHPILLNAIVCSTDGRKIVDHILGEDQYRWIQYKTPGVMLSKEIQKSIEQNNAEEDQIIILENHGLIVVSSSPKKTVQVTNEVINKIISYYKKNNIELFQIEEFGKEQIESGKCTSKLVAEFMKNESNTKLLDWFIYPDMIVFCSCGFSFNKKDPKKISLYDDGTIELPEEMKIPAESMVENIIAVITILLIMRQFANPQFMPEEKVEHIRSMESEKYRQELKKE